MSFRARSLSVGPESLRGRFTRRKSRSQKAVLALQEAEDIQRRMLEEMRMAERTSFGEEDDGFPISPPPPKPPRRHAVSIGPSDRLFSAKELEEKICAEIENGTPQKDIDRLIQLMESLPDIC